MRKEKSRRILFLGIALLFAFALWTLLVKYVDVQPIGPNNSAVGFATLNGFVHDFLGVNMSLYTITDWLSLIPVGFIFCFGLIGLFQLISRKSIKKVDASILVLGGFYVAVMSAYVFFEYYVVNYRPVLISGFLEASYPSSTTLLVLTVMSTAIMQLSCIIKIKTIRKVVTCLIVLFTIFMVVSRLISGVHWLTDIIGGAILSAGLVLIYYSFMILVTNRE